MIFGKDFVFVCNQCVDVFKLCIVDGGLYIGNLVFEVDEVGLELFVVWYVVVVVQCYYVVVQCVVVGDEYVVFVCCYGFGVME